MLTSLNYYSHFQTRIREKNLKKILWTQILFNITFKTGIDEGNFNVAGNLFHNTLPLYLLRFVSKYFWDQEHVNQF